MLGGVVVLYILLNNAHCFNIDTNHPVIYKDPVGGRSYFGYSIVGYAGGDNQKWIRIGAPRANDIEDKASYQTGVVYSCALDDGFKDCDVMRFPGNTNNEIRNSSWIGGTMDINHEHKQMTVCGFRRHFHDNADYYTVGGCYWSDSDMTSFQDVDRLKTKLLSDPYWYKQYFYAQAQSGFSAHFSEKGELVLGAPGAFGWSGTVINVRNEISDHPGSNRKRRRVPDEIPEPYERRRRHLTNYMVDIAPQDNDVSNLNELMGYSVSSGYFYGRDELIYVAGSPKGHLKASPQDTYKGKVLLFKFHEEFKLQRKEILPGKQLGEYFGHSLDVGRINNDGYDDLIVGAPYYRNEGYNEGRVVVYLGGKDNLTEATELKGNFENGQFGSAVMFLGDIDGDGFGDVAISAPYQSGGVVYIYRGQENGLNAKPCQEISGKEIFPDLRGFGMSLSRPVDLDNNGYKDVVIGAPLSGHAVYLRSQPLIVITNSFLSIPSILEDIKSNFTLEACFWYSVFTGDEASISFEIKVEAFNLVHTERNFTVYKEKVCRSVNVSLEQYYFTSPTFTATLSYTHHPGNPAGSVTVVPGITRDNFCASCPVLDAFRSSGNYTEVKIPISLDCGEDDVCVSGMEMVAGILGTSGNAFTVGSGNFLTLLTFVTNKGENAYNATIKVASQDNIPFVDLDSKCSYLNGKSTILCHVDNPLRHNATKEMMFNLDMRAINRKYITEDLRINFHLDTFSNDSVKEKYYNYTVKIRDADVTILGLSEQSDYFFGNESGEVARLTHVYKVAKSGPTPLNKLRVTINIPYMYNSMNGLIEIAEIEEPSLFFMKKSWPCTSSLPRRKRRGILNLKAENNPENNKFYLNCSTKGVICSTVECNFGPFEDTNEVAEVKLEMRVLTGNLTDLTSAGRVAVISTLSEVAILEPENFEQNGRSPDQVIVTTYFKNISTEPVQVWVIVISIILGLLLLVLLIAILTRVGFFHRTIKEELESKRVEAAIEDEITATENLQEPFMDVELPEPSEFASSDDLIDQ